MRADKPRFQILSLESDLGICGPFYFSNRLLRTSRPCPGFLVTCGLTSCFAILFAMTFAEIRLEEIDFENETFRISEELYPAPLLDSLREIGQVNPVLLLEGRAPKKAIVCGFRRLRALKLLRIPRALSRIIPAGSWAGFGRA